MGEHKKTCFYFIIPIYNAEQYLKDTVQSILQQTYKNYTVIFVDDGSVDSSPKICHSYCEKYNNFHYLSCENQGPLHARELGLEFAIKKMAPEDYIWFVDSDDYIEKDALYKLFEAQKEKHPDVIIFNYAKDNVPESELNNPITGYTDSQRKLFLVAFTAPGYGSLWRYVFSKRAFPIPKLPEFYEFRFCEDKLQSAYIMKNCKNALFLSETLYHYRSTPSSLVNTENEMIKWNYAIRVWDEVWRLLNDNNIVGEYERNYYLICYQSAICYQLKNIVNTPLSYDDKIKEMKKLTKFKISIDTSLSTSLREPLISLFNNEFSGVYRYVKKQLFIAKTKRTIKKIIPKITNKYTKHNISDALKQGETIRKIYDNII